MSAKYSRIISTGSALPAARITNEDLARRLAADGIETSDEWIRTRTGIEARRFVNGTTETTTTLAAAAAQKALEGGGVDPKTIDLIIVATTTPDQVFPSTAAAVQRLIGAAGCAAFDVQAVCAGFIYALNAADAMLRAGPYQRALVIGAETMSRVIDMKDRATCVLFGDGAGQWCWRPRQSPVFWPLGCMPTDPTMKMCSVSRHGLITVNFAGVPTSIWTAVRSLSLPLTD